MAIKIICAWCGEWMGLKPSDTDNGICEPLSHSICHLCRKKVLSEADQFLDHTTKVSDRKENSHV